MTMMVGTGLLFLLIATNDVSWITGISVEMRIPAGIPFNVSDSHFRRDTLLIQKRLLFF